MQWFGKGSNNVEDGRGSRGGLAIGGGAGIILLILGLLFGQDLTGLVSQIPGITENEAVKTGQPLDSMGRFVSGTLESTEIVWTALFQEMGKTYEKPTLRLFSERVQTGCGSASASVGPFYCPADQKIYLDVSFYQELSERFGSQGDFAQAYVIAHEVGHHVQNLLGISQNIEKARGMLSEHDFNKLSVKLELQADFYAGVWAHQAQKLKDFRLDPGDLKEALHAANAIGDDKLQRQIQGEVIPDSFTHGTSEQRMFWFKRGFDTGDLSLGDTFNTSKI